MQIEKLTHTCLVQDGPMAGNTHRQEVNRYDVQFGNACDNCGDILATVDELILHVYEQLTS